MWRSVDWWNISGRGHRRMLSIQSTLLWHWRLEFMSPLILHLSIDLWFFLEKTGDLVTTWPPAERVIRHLSCGSDGCERPSWSCSLFSHSSSEGPVMTTEPVPFGDEGHLALGWFSNIIIQTSSITNYLCSNQYIAEKTYFSRYSIFNSHRVEWDCGWWTFGPTLLRFKVKCINWVWFVSKRKRSAL